MTEKTIKPLKELTLLDRFLFAEAMEDPVTNRLVLEIILGEELSLMGLAQAEKEFRLSPLVRSIRVDVYSIDEHGRVFDTEVQKEDRRNLPRRSRLYQSLIDSVLMPPGTVDFNALSDCYIIIISPFDLIGAGRYSYTFRMRCDENPEYCLGDGAVRIFLNTRGTDGNSASLELIEMLHYFEQANGEVFPPIAGDKLKQIHKRVQAVRSSEEIGVKYLNLWEEKWLEQQEAKEEGRSEGQQLTLIHLIRKSIKQNVPIETLTILLDFDRDIILQLRERILANPNLSDEELIKMLPKNI
ncbi:MAG: Rpn family recombination-promoting nuclease/putative transposase [Lachnospiraceae bacterium]